MKFATAIFLELDLPQPHNYVAHPIFAGQELSKDTARADGDAYTEETWTEYAKQLCYNTPACTTVNAYQFGPSGALNGTGDETYWFAYLYAGPTSNIYDWVHLDNAPISHQRMFTSIVH
ncbi:hypothetical protein PWT90_03407 [Aphanocladium album]|nr:hypothetical protein PWT90_03407 [Aphanocladium album]